jgi:hypothetical protein
VATETRCTCGQGHLTFGACVRAKNIRVAYCGQGGDATRQKEWDRELDLYFSAVKQGVEPAGTKMHQIRDALDRSDAMGVAYDASAPAVA